MTSATRTQPAWRLPAALVISVLLHLVALAAVTGGAAPAVRLDLGAILDRPEPEETPLGLERSRTVSVAWLGFETPTEHQAPRSAVEQSALEIDPGRLGAVIQAAATSAREARQAAEAAAATVETVVARAAEGIRLAQQQAEQARQAEQLATAISAPPAAPAPAPEMPTETLESGASGAGEGRQAEKEADATALTEPMEVRLGRTASGEGLEIFTQRPPRFTMLVRRMARPRNPLVDIRFKPDGSVGSAGFHNDEGTGYAAVDEPLLDAIYGWRARGRRLEALGEGETLTVSIRILLN